MVFMSGLTKRLVMENETREVREQFLEGVGSFSENEEKNSAYFLREVKGKKEYIPYWGNVLY